MIERKGTIDYDAELRLHDTALRRALALDPDDQVLDIGCGAGQTTRDAARIASEGSALGIDPSAPMIQRAREVAEAEGLPNVTFVHGDAQVHPFPPAHFDVAISRFGTMFFDDPRAAFTNIARALQPRARLVMMVWQAHEQNEWSVALEHSLTGDGGISPPVHEAPDPFSLADRDTVVSILEQAGFVDVTFSDVRQPVYYGPDVATALEWVRGFACTQHVLKSSDATAAQRALEHLRETLASRARTDGIWFDSRAWIVAALRR